MNVIVVVVALLFIASVIILTNKEKFVFNDDTIYPYAYQNNLQPVYLSRYAMELRNKPALELCKNRVQAQCSQVHPLYKTECILNSMRKCRKVNNKTIYQSCVDSLPSTICRNSCVKGKQSCSCCVQYMKANGVCQRPDF
jgi:hypothetical protein